MYTEYKHNIDVNIHVQHENSTVQIPIGDREHTLQKVEETSLQRSRGVGV
jgi:hypothetical protein